MELNKDIYTEERQIVLNKLFDILEVNEKNKKISLTELDNNEKKQNDIMNLIDDIKKYFFCSKWTYFKHKKRQMKRIYLSLIKNIMRYMNVKIVTSVLYKTYSGNIRKSETYYIFNT
jgi:hypothetical protein